MKVEPASAPAVSALKPQAVTNGGQRVGATEDRVTVEAAPPVEVVAQAAAVDRGARAGRLGEVADRLRNGAYAVDHDGLATRMAEHAREVRDLERQLEEATQESVDQ